MNTKKTRGDNTLRKLVVYEDPVSGTIFLRPCRRKNGRYKLRPSSEGKAFSKFSAFNAELGKQVKKFLKYCD